MNNLDHNEHKVARSRLYGRVLQVNGPSQLAAIYPFLQARLEKSFAAETSSGRGSDGKMPATSEIHSALTKLECRLLICPTCFNHQKSSFPYDEPRFFWRRNL